MILQEVRTHAETDEGQIIYGRQGVIGIQSKYGNLMQARIWLGVLIGSVSDFTGFRHCNYLSTD